MERGGLSIRGTQGILKPAEYLNDYLDLCDGDSYDPKKNPNGCISLGIAVNGIHSDIVKKKFESQVLSGAPNLYQYFSEHGTKRLQKAMAEYMTTFFETSQPVQPENVYFMTSAMSALDVLAHCLADAGDVFLCATPVYAGIVHGFGTRSHVKLWPIPLTSESEVPFQLTMKGIEESFGKAREAGKHVAGMILLNPGNPVGDVIPIDLIEEIVQFCHKHQLHFISDEVYAMSIHDPSVKFHSVLKLPSLPDPERTHIIYAISKDLGLTRLRVGVLHTFNKALQEQVVRMANLQCVAYPIMEILANILEDKEWCKSLFEESNRLMRELYLSTARKLRALNLQVHDTPAAIYLWVNFKHYCKPLTFESEERLFAQLIREAKLIIYPGAMFGAQEPGWFRIIFTLDKDTIEKGIQRLENFLLKLEDKSSE